MILIRAKNLKNMSEKEIKKWTDDDLEAAYRNASKLGTFECLKDFLLKRRMYAKCADEALSLSDVNVSLGNDVKEERRKILTDILYKHCNEADHCKIREVDFEEIVNDIVNET